MFLTITLFTLGIVTFITFYDWILIRTSTKSPLRKLKHIEHLISLQDWEKAEKSLSLLFAKGKSGKEAYLLEIQILRSQGYWTQALEKIQKYRRMFPEELLFRLEEGKALLELQAPQEALNALQVCSPILRGESDILLLASAFCKAGYPKQSLEILMPHLKGSENGLAFSLAGEAHFKLKHFLEAIQYYQKAIELGYKTHQISLQIAHAYRRLGHLVYAEKIFYTLLGKDKTDIDATLGLGACLQERHLYPKALLIYQAALVSHPQELRLLYHAAYSALRAKKYRVAESYFFEFLQYQDRDPQILFFYGFCMESQKKWQEAEQIYLKLIQGFPNFYHGYRALAWMFGVGLSQTLSETQGLNFAHLGLNLKNDLLSWEILSACIARIGQFEKAYQIQLMLAKEDTQNEMRLRRQQTLRALRKKTPLIDSQVSRIQVA